MLLGPRLLSSKLVIFLSVHYLDPDPGLVCGAGEDEDNTEGGEEEEEKEEHPGRLLIPITHFSLGPADVPHSHMFITKNE